MQEEEHHEVSCFLQASYEGIRLNFLRMIFQQAILIAILIVLCFIHFLNELLLIYFGIHSLIVQNRFFWKIQEN